MRLSLISLFAVVLAVVAGEPQFPSPYLYGGLPVYPAGTEGRSFFSLTAYTVTLYTTTTTATTTATTTCTTSAATLTTCTAGRRRRGLVASEDESWFIAPSVVQSVEKTEEASVESLRTSRQADEEVKSPQGFGAVYSPEYASFGQGRIFLSFAIATTTTTTTTTTTSALTATCSSTTSYSTCSSSG